MTPTSDTEGRSIVIKGELKASEDLTIDGQVDGRIELLQNVLTVGTTAKLHAEIVARAVIVLGEVVGNITATERVEIKAERGSVEGDIVTPRIAIAEGAHFTGRIEMRSAGELKPGNGGRRPEPSKAAAPAAGPGSPPPVQAGGPPKPKPAH
jgi:cytoskeletal protein CcmA (bactofilin family)